MRGDLRSARIPGVGAVLAAFREAKGGAPYSRRRGAAFRRSLMVVGLAALLLPGCGSEENVKRIAHYDEGEANEVGQSIRQTYESQFSELDQNAQAHFAIRIFRATGTSPNLDAVTVDMAQWVYDLERRLESLGVEGYIEYESRLAHDQQRDVTAVQRARKEMFASRKEMLFHRRVLYIAHKLRDLGLHEGEFREDYEAARRHLKRVDFAGFLLDPEVIRTYAAQTSNLIFWLKRIDVVDLEDEYTRAFQEVFMSVDDDELSKADYQNKLYGLTHFIIGDSHYYQRTVSARKHRWILDYYDRHILEILSWSKPDIVAEIALCFKLCQLPDHRVVTMAQEYLSDAYDSSLGFVPSEDGLSDFNNSEHRNAIAYLVLADWDDLYRGPRLDEDAVRAFVPVDIEPPVAPLTIPVGGYPVEELSAFDWAMAAYMEANDISAGLLGVMRDGEVIFERSYGWKDEARREPLAPDALMRIASVTKPFTAAAVRKMVESGIVSLDDFVFDLGQEGGGLLDIDPYPALGDERLRDVTLRHLLEHTAGWDAEIAGDLTFRELEIAEEMGVRSPPGRANTARWILGQPLQFSPGESAMYSNEGYFFLGLIIEKHTGQAYMDYLWSSVLEPAGIARSEITLARTLRSDSDQREPWYESRGFSESVLEPGKEVEQAYGSWSVEDHLSTGRLVASTRAILRFLDTYYIIGSRIGERRDEGDSGEWKLSHTGGFAGTSALARQRGDGIQYAVIFNKRAALPADYASIVRQLLDRVIEDEIEVWPTKEGPPPMDPSSLASATP